MQKFEWPEFRPGDRVMVRRPSEEAPAYNCGCRPSEVWDWIRRSQPQDEFFILQHVDDFPARCEKCGARQRVQGYRVGKEGYTPAVVSPFNLELLEGADD